jgi:hypothetical protein
MKSTPVRKIQLFRDYHAEIAHKKIKLINLVFGNNRLENNTKNRNHWKF